jgi:hypothetical protein
MTDLTYNITSIFIAEVLLVIALLNFDKKTNYDIHLNPEFTLNANYVDYLWMPIGIQVLGIIIFSGWTENFTNGLMRTLPSFVLTILAVAFLVIKRYRRFYFTDNGLYILYLAMDKLDKTSLKDIKRGGIKKTIRSTMYFIETPKGQINFSRGQIGNEKQFREYFRRHGIDYYLYSSSTGMYEKVD